MKDSEAILALLANAGINSNDVLESGQTAFEYLESAILGALDEIEEIQPQLKLYESDHDSCW